jgi:sigma-B regulation protein RsbU (phosphoserine phosphatase)
MADHKKLMRLVGRAAKQIDAAPEHEKTVKIVADAIIGRFRDELGIYGGRLYRREGDHYRLLATVGEAKPVEEEVLVPVDYEPTQLVLAERVLFMDAADPRTDPSLEATLGAGVFAAIELDNGNHILAFDISPGHDRDDILVALGILRHSINHKLRQRRLEGIFEESRRIQTSILPRSSPDFADFELAGRSDPLEEVGGDFYDFIPISESSLGLAVADASGHGMPAALQVRDIHVGLRMGMARDFKIARTVERLNQIIHESTLTSRFVSMVYGELEDSGVFIFVNAGHPPPLLLRPDGSFRRLRSSGPVLGPLEHATYRRGFARLRPGDILVLYTDGIIETQCGHRLDEMYGEDRLRKVVEAHREAPAREIIDAIFASLDEFCGGREADDDRTVVVVKRPRASIDPDA